MINPCDNCHKKGCCPTICYPRKDYEKHIKKLQKKRKYGGK